MRQPGVLDIEWWWDDFISSWAVICSGITLAHLLVVVGTNDNDEREVAADLFVRSLLAGLSKAGRR